ncbi:hypothetical protein Tco_0863655, partial [Tanacetum coccineum]
MRISQETLDMPFHFLGMSVANRVMFQVAASEAGWITQGIGAYKVQDFGAMRACGSHVTDIAMRPQTTKAPIEISWCGNSCGH